MRKNGFTMIELLVVLAILGLLLTLGLNTYSRSLSRGRDAKRVEDMKQIQKGFELYYSINDSEYPMNPAGPLVSTVFDDEQFFPTGLPVAPANGLDYVGESDGSIYMVCAGLENPDNYGNAGCTNNDITTCDFTNTPVTHYCVTAAQ